MPRSAKEARVRWYSPKGGLPLLTLALVLAVFGGTVWFVSVEEEREVRPGIINRDGEILQAVILLEQLSELQAEPGFSLQDEAAQFRLLLNASRLKGVIGARLFDRDGRFVVAFPENVTRGEISSDDLAALRTLRPVSRFDPALELHPAHLLDGTMGAVPILDVLVPLHEFQGTQLLGVAQFIIDGGPLAERLAQIRRAELRQSWLVFAVGSGLITLVLGWALSRLQRRTDMLLKANRELALAAKTAAVGAISAQLIHGLKSPLFGVQSILSRRGGAGADADPALEAAKQAMQRMGGTVNRIMDMLRDQEGLDSVNRPAAQLLADVRGRLTPVAAEKDVRLEIGSAPGVELPAQVSNLVQIILTNLLQNAIEATPAGKSVSLVTNWKRDDGLFFEVRDEGPGIAEQVREELFLPCESRKPGGGGVGLSISQQLARYLGGELKLRSTGPQGSVFAFHLPAAHLTGITGNVRRNLDTPLLV